MSVRSDVYDALKNIPGVAKVDNVWPAVFAELPFIYYAVENRKPLANFTYDQESDVTIRVVVWSKTSASTLALSVSSAMHTIGYRRTQERDRDETDNHIIGIEMRFTALK